MGGLLTTPGHSEISVAWKMKANFPRIRKSLKDLNAKITVVELMTWRFLVRSSKDSHSHRPGAEQYENHMEVVRYEW